MRSKLIAVLAIMMAVSTLTLTLSACHKKAGHTAKSGTSSHSAVLSSVSDSTADSGTSSGSSSGSSSSAKNSSANAAVAVTGVSINQASVSLTVGQTVKLSAAVSPSNATDKTVKWTSSDLNIASHDDSGDITAKGSGTAYIYATATNGVKGSCKVVVSGGSTGTQPSTKSGTTGGGTGATAPVQTDQGAQPPAGYSGSGLAYNSSLSQQLNSITGENKNSAYFSTLFNDSLGVALGQNTLDNLLNKYGNEKDKTTKVLYYSGGVGYDVTPYSETSCNVNSNNANTLYSSAKSAGIFKYPAEFVNNGYEVSSQRFVWTYVIYDGNAHTNKLIRIVWYVMKAPTRVS